MTGGVNRNGRARLVTTDEVANAVNTLNLSSRQEVAAHFGISETTAYNRLSEAGIKFNNPIQPTPRQANDLREEGMTTRAIAEHYGVSWRTADERLKQYDAENDTPRPKRKDSALTPDLAREAYVDRGMTARQIAREYMTSLATASLHLDRARVTRRTQRKNVSTEYLRQLYEVEGLSAAQIAEREDVPLVASNVAERLNAIGVDMSSSPLDDPLLVMHLAYHRGVPETEIARDPRIRASQRWVYEEVNRSIEWFGGVIDPSDCHYCGGS